MSEPPIDKKKMAAIIAAALLAITGPVLCPPALAMAPKLIQILNKDTILIHNIQMDPLLTGMEWKNQTADNMEEPRAAARLQQGGEQITNEWLQTRTEADLCYCFGCVFLLPLLTCTDMY